MAVNRLSLTGVLWIALSLPQLAAAQNTADSSADRDGERPRVGLVLSGGGARGGAQIGILKALEELRIPVDIIAGTSIGAVIGGLYASGMSAEDLEEALDSVDWEAAFLNVTPRQLRSFRRKRDDDVFLVQQRPGLGDEGHFELPIGLIQGQVIDLILSRWVVPVAAVRHFDELAIPFRAVAADIVSGEAVVLESGNLARAMRASMSLPAALAPVEIDDRLLVDGGIVMNLPVDVAKEMGADMVIAVDISAGLRGREDLRSVLDVSLQLSTLLTREGLDSQLAKLEGDDVLLTPPFPDHLSATNYVRMGESIPIGYALVMQERASLEHLAVDEETYAAYRRRVRAPRREEPPVVEFVRLSNHSQIADRVIEARLRDVIVGEPLDLDSVERAINRVYGLDLYQNVRYDLVTENGQTGLEVELQERSWGPNYLQLGVDYSAAADESVLFGLAVSYLRTAINELGGEWRVTLMIGDEPGVLSDLYQPLGYGGRYFFAPALRLQSNLLNVYDDDYRILAQLQLRETELEIAAGRDLGSWGEFRLGVRAASGNADVKVGDPLLTSDDYRRGELFARFAVDTFDNIAFPRSGALASTELRSSRTGTMSADADYDQLLMDVGYARSWGRHTLLTRFRHDVTMSGEAPIDRLARLGGFLDLSGLNQGALAGQHVSRVALSYYRRIGNLALLPAFAGLSLEAGNAWDARGDMRAGDTIVGGSIAAGVDTPIGPIYVGYGRAQGGRDALYVFLGRIF